MRGFSCVMYGRKHRMDGVRLIHGKSLFEGLSLMDQSVANKTPVSWLHEICTRNNISPKYELLQVEGAVHEPIFQYRLTLEYNGRALEETGTGRSKKEAKHNTARAMLRAMNITPTDLYGMNGGANPGLDDELKIGNDTDVGGNPVGVLQELCMKMKYPPPSYDVDSEEGLPHERQFAIACRVGDQFVEIGKGKSKKLAKRVAAHMMAERLRSLPLETANTHAYDDDDDKIVEQINSLYVTSKHRKGIPIKNNIEKIVQLYKIHWGLSGNTLNMIKDPKFETDNPEQIVNALEAEHNFKAMFIELDEITSTNQYQCLVQITVEPPAVLIGAGDTIAEARRKCSEDVLKFFAEMSTSFDNKK